MLCSLYKTASFNLKSLSDNAPNTAREQRAIQMACVEGMLKTVLRKRNEEERLQLQYVL